METFVTIYPRGTRIREESNGRTLIIEKKLRRERNND